MGRDFSLASLVVEAPPQDVARPADVEVHPNDRALHVLTLTPFFPREDDDADGCFVAEALPPLMEQGIRHFVIAARPLHRGTVRTGDAGTPARAIRYPAFPGNCGLPSAGVSLFTRIAAEVRRLHRKQKIDLIHAHAALPCGHAAMLLGRALRIPYVVTVHGLDVYSVRQSGVMLGGWCRRISRKVYRQAASVICVSEKVREQIGDEAVYAIVVHNGVDAEHFPCTGRAPESPRLLSVGNLISIKGHDLVLRAMAMLKHRLPNLQYEIVGDGPERRSLESAALRFEISERVHFRGRRSRQFVSEAVERCSVFVLPSSYEALGCVYLEAMSAGKPVVACRGQGIQDIIHHGVNGWLTGVNDPEDLSSSLTCLLGSERLRQRLGTAARQTVADKYTLAHQAEKLARIYRECAR
jgi:teichuronic acid biosynthesis glycosyltransferase TuaC